MSKRSEKSQVLEKLAIVEADQKRLVTDLANCNKDKLGLAEVVHDLERRIEIMNASYKNVKRKGRK